MLDRRRIQVRSSARVDIFVYSNTVHPEHVLQPKTSPPSEAEVKNAWSRTSDRLVSGRSCVGCRPFRTTGFVMLHSLQATTEALIPVGLPYISVLLPSSGALRRVVRR
jgi:hypothetical protein